MIKNKYTYIIIPLLLSAGISAHSLYPHVDTPAVNATTLIANNVPHRLLSESNFVFRPYKRPFDADSFFQEHAPQWQSLSETLTHWGGATGIDPRVILTTLAITEKWPGAEAPDEHTLTHIKDEIKRIANQLSQQFYTYKYQKDLYNYSAPTLSIVNQLNQFSDWQAWNDQYKSWFGGDATDDAELLQTQSLKTAATTPTVPAQGFMQWPWRQGFNWIPNGPHSYTGSGYPLSSVDVSYDWPKWGATTYDIAAANDGYVSVLSRCELRVTNQNGWSTNYYHMDGIQVEDGQWVDKNTVLGYYANNKSAALCSGGSSTGPHMHFSVLYNGVYQSIQGMTFGPYKVQVGRDSYDDNCNYAWLTDTRSNKKVCFWNRVENPVE